MTAHRIRLGADIGGTFTDVILDCRGRMFSRKVLTNYAAPEQAVLDGMAIVAAEASIELSQIEIAIHGTTLATNALIERRGARTAFVTTEGFRDVIEMRTESRFDQYDLNLALPPPLVPREDRMPVKGRIGATGEELQPLDEVALGKIAEHIASSDFGAVAIGFIHSYANPEHEHRAREIIARRTNLPISISSEVSPQMREYERFNTVCANAYVRPRIGSYLARLKRRLREMGTVCPIFMIHSGGGLMSVESATEFPVRLVESGPAGGAIFAVDVAQRFGLQQVVSYDMGGTTAKICLIDNYEPRTARTFEVARSNRFAKGSGMPISIPVIDMIEIGAGGGSLARIDAMGRIQTGPESAGSEPGPACYRRGGTSPTITDADLALGKLDPDNFASGTIVLSLADAHRSIEREIGIRLQLPVLASAFGICEVVDENMANAARIHAIENGKDISANVMIAFGGAAPLHAARLCEKLGIDRCLVPHGAGVGSAIGFLKAPFAYEALVSQLVRLSEFDPAVAHALVSELRQTALAFVEPHTAGGLRCEVVAFMRYVGQGWEIPIVLPYGALEKSSAATLRESFGEAYARFFGRAIDGMQNLDVEIVTWSVKVTEVVAAPTRCYLESSGRWFASQVSRQMFDPGVGEMLESAIVERESLRPGDAVSGPAVIVERETATVVTASFNAVMQQDGSLLLIRKEQAA